MGLSLGPGDGFADFGAFVVGSFEGLLEEGP